MDTPLTEIIRTGLYLEDYEQEELSIVAGGIGVSVPDFRSKVESGKSGRSGKVSSTE
jgi:hypothetical protein